MQVLSKADARKLHSSLRILIAEDDVLLPSETQLQELVSRAFWASLEKEEGRPSIFALCFSPPKASKMSQSLVFEEAQDLNVSNIVKLFPALLPGRRAIGVQADAREDLEIWGMLPLPNPGLTVEAVGPGHIAVRFLGRNRMVLRSGETTILRNDHSDNLILVLITLSEQEWEVTMSMALLAEALKKIIDAMVQQAHGGTLLWIPDGVDWQSSVKSIRYLCKPPYQELAEYLDKLTNQLLEEKSFGREDHRNSPLYEQLNLYMQEIKPTLDGIAQLTAVDGAMVLSEGLEVLAFGVMLQSQDRLTQRNVAVLELGRYTENSSDTLEIRVIPLSKLGGARHRSAAEFCCAHKRALAFVASQDGTLTVFGWQSWSDRLFAVRRAELDSL